MSIKVNNPRDSVTYRWINKGMCHEEASDQMVLLELAPGLGRGRGRIGRLSVGAHSQGWEVTLELTELKESRPLFETAFFVFAEARILLVSAWLDDNVVPA